jgi:glycerol uptake facilitator protein
MFPLFEYFYRADSKNAYQNLISTRNGLSISGFEFGFDRDSNSHFEADDSMNVYLAEFLGTAILILLGNGVVANVVLNRTKGHGGGWIVITAGWAFAVFVAVLCVGGVSGAHINPAVSVGLAAANQFEWDLVPGYIIAQMLGAIVGAGLVHTCYKAHFDATDDADLKLACFCNAPSIPSIPRNFFCEAVATFVLVYAVMLATEPSFQLVDAGGSTNEVQVGLGSLGALPVGLVVFAIGLSLGGTTGYAINPARDLGPRIAHALLPIAGKRDSNWGYAAIPVVGPIFGAVLAAALFLATS